jgi:hypothetical protein
MRYAANMSAKRENAQINLVKRAIASHNYRHYNGSRNYYLEKTIISLRMNATRVARFV